jgi:ribosomal protein L11 methyltransferase
MPTSEKWIEVSLLVDGELAEAVAEVLSRFAPQGVVIESTAIAPDREGQGYPTGPMRVCAYLPVDHELEHKRQRLEEALWYLGRISPIPPPQFKPIEEVDWVSAWKKH